jgi:hypothetical protein
MPLRRRTTAAVAACAAIACLAAAATAPSAGASPSIRYGLKDDAWLLHGPGAVSDRVARLQALGVELVRFSLDWSKIAPSRPADPTDPDDPAYAWDGADQVLEALRQQGVATLLDLVGTPRWANGGRGPSSAPRSAGSIAGFATAAARRYPWVRRWTIWNEPNQRRWLVPTSPAVYVTKLLNPAYAALHKTLPQVQVAGGVTAPRGGRGGVSPVDWIRGMARAGARLDAYAHNPYPLDPRRETPTTGGCGHCLTLTMATLPRLVGEVGRAFGRARIWLTEYGYQTSPPDRLLGVSPAKQAAYLGEAALRAYRSPRVDVLIHFLYRDEPTLGRFQSGLVYLSNRPKPSLAAFELPLAQRSRSGAKVVLWGQVRVSEQPAVRLEVYRGGWRTLGSPRRTSARGYFGWTGTLPPGARVRAVAGAVKGAAITVR